MSTLPVINTRARAYLRDPWLSPGVISAARAAEIEAIHGFDKALPLLDNVIRLGWGDAALVRYNADKRPAFGGFPAWARANLELEAHV